jgi:hypothetical protein
MKKVGWRNTILINIGLILIFPLTFNKEQIVMFAVISALMAFRNYQFLPMVKSLGENGYSERLKEYYGNARGFDFWVPALIKFVVIFLIGLFIITSKAVDKNNQTWFVPAIGQGLIFYAGFFLVIEIWTRKALLKNNEAA